MIKLLLAVASLLFSHQAPPAQPPADGITEKEAIEFARLIEQGLLDGKPEAFDSVIDSEAIVEESTRGLELTSRERAAFGRGVTKGSALGKSFDSKSGSSFRFLRQRLVDGKRQLVFRHFRTEGFNYQEFRLGRKPTGEIRIVDVFSHLNGEWTTAQGRRMALSIVADDPTRRGKLQRRDVDLAEHFEAIQKLNLVALNGNPAEAQAIYDSLPDTLKQEKIVQMLKLQAARRLGPAEFVKAEEEFNRRLPGDASKDMIGMYAHYHKGEYERSIKCIDSVDSSIGGDPLLEFFRGNAYLKMGKLDQAKRAGQKATREVPYILEPRALLVSISLKEKGHTETLALLLAIERDFGVVFENLESNKEYAEFVKSNEYRDWMKSRASK